MKIDWLSKLTNFLQTMAFCLAVSAIILIVLDINLRFTPRHEVAVLGIAIGAFAQSRRF